MTEKKNLIVGVNDMELDPPKPGYTRIYEMFHEYRDVSPEEMEANKNDPLLKILREEIMNEINREIIAEINKAARQ